MPTEEKSVQTASDAILKAQSFDELISAAGGAVVRGADVIGDGYELLDDKATLIKVPFILVDWERIVDEKSGREYVSIRLMTKDGRKLRVNDGSTGIYAQIGEMEEAGIVSGTPVYFSGLRRSDYVKEGVGDATTFYLAA